MVVLVWLSAITAPSTLNENPGAARKSFPLTVTVVPPVVGPELGETLEIVGAAAKAAGAKITRELITAEESSSGKKLRDLLLVN
jgi:hypothetical protein